MELKIETSGDTFFPKEGGVFALRIMAGAASPGEAERSVIHPSQLHVDMDRNGNFIIRTTKTENDYLVVEIEAGENRGDSVVHDKLIVSARINGVLQSKEVELSQQEAEITYRNMSVSCEKGNLITIPANGGAFEIPVNSKHEVYINGKYDSTITASLAGLGFEYTETNCAGLHTLTYKRDESTAGRYVFTYAATGPYNLNFEWDGESNEGLIPTQSYFVITDGDDELLKVQFVQPQTPGEEYYYGMLSRYVKYKIQD